MYTTISLCKCGVTNENNRSYLKNNWYIGENNQGAFRVGEGHLPPSPVA